MKTMKNDRRSHKLSTVSCRRFATETYCVSCEEFLPRCVKNASRVLIVMMLNIWRCMLYNVKETANDSAAHRSILAIFIYDYCSFHEVSRVMRTMLVGVFLFEVRRFFARGRNLIWNLMNCCFGKKEKKRRSGEIFLYNKRWYVFWYFNSSIIIVSKLFHRSLSTRPDSTQYIYGQNRFSRNGRRFIYRLFLHIIFH